MHSIDITGTSVQIIHENSRGNITIAKSIDGSNSTFKHLWYGKYGKVEIPDTNSFFSINTFIGWRSKENICELKANFLDFDFEFHKDKERFLLAYKKGRFSALPKPTLLICSGHGIWMLWCYIDVAYCRKGRGKESTVNHAMLNKWKNIQKLLFEKTGLKADKFALDVARVMRPSGSINEKPNMSPKQVEVLEYNPNCFYTLEELYTSLSGMSRKQYFDAQAKAKAPKKTNKSQKGKKSNYNLLKTNRDRVSDFEKLVEIRPNGFYEGCRYRELYLFIYAYHVQILTHNIAETLDKVRLLNKQFRSPLPDDELTTAVINTVEQGVKNREVVILIGKYAGKRKGYNYKTATLIKHFQIDENEQEQLKTLCNDDIKYSRNKCLKKANIRNENGLTAKQQQKLNDRYAVHCYSEQGKTISEIAKLLKISTRTVFRYIGDDKPESRLFTASFTKKEVVA